MKNVKKLLVALSLVLSSYSFAAINSTPERMSVVTPQELAKDTCTTIFKGILSTDSLFCINQQFMIGYTVPKNIDTCVKAIIPLAILSKRQPICLTLLLGELTEEEREDLMIKGSVIMNTYGVVLMTTYSK